MMAQRYKVDVLILALELFHELESDDALAACFTVSFHDCLLATYLLFSVVFVCFFGWFVLFSLQAAMWTLF